MLECFVHSQDRTTFVDGLFGLMADYSIPLSGEDSGMLSTIKTSLDSLSSSTETKKANKSVLLGKFQEELSSEVATLKENILNITQVCSKDTKLISFQIQEIESPALLDPESAYEEIKQTLEQVIQERHFINYADLRKTYCEIQDVLSGISDMGMIEVGPTRTYTLTEFCQEQEDRCKPLHRSFKMRLQRKLDKAWKTYFPSGSKSWTPNC